MPEKFLAYEFKGIVQVAQIKSTIKRYNFYLKMQENSQEKTIGS